MENSNFVNNFRRQNLSSRIKNIEPKLIRVSKIETDTPYDEDHIKTRNIREMYERYPYPSPISDKNLIYDVANVIELIFPDQELDDWNILDAGCGTGHRLIALAERYPKANFTGMDITENSLKIGKSIIKNRNTNNVDFLQKNIYEIDRINHYDLIVSTGVIHHLVDPKIGLEKLCNCLTDDGIILIWLYHALGEFERLLNRELALLLLKDKSNYEKGLNLLEDLNVKLSFQRYGLMTNVKSSQNITQQSLDVDAFLHPIVNAYRFHESVEMFREIIGIDWIAINGINFESNSKLIDLKQVDCESNFCLKEKEFIINNEILSSYKKSNDMDKLKIIELILKPNGFTIIAGKNDSVHKCSRRIQNNLI